MVKTLGVIFLAVLMAVPIAILDQKYSGGFLYEFFRSEGVGIVATVLALNVATVTFLVGHLVGVEAKAKKPLFKKTRKEIQSNVYFMSVLFFLIFVLTSSTNEKLNISINAAKFNPLVFIVLVLFILVFVTLLEIVRAIFKATEFLNTETKIEK